jgi:AraC-like DNA-binding protein
MFRDAAPPRGILARAPAGDLEHRRVLAAPALAPFVAHFWWVRWSLAEPFVAENLPHPSVHVVFEAPGGGCEATGVRLARFVRRLSGEGRVFGIKFRPAMFSALPDAARRLAGVVRDEHSLDQAVAAVEPVLARLLPAPARELLRLRDLVERLEHDRDLLRVEECAAALGLDVRSLERAFRRHVGASPKRVIRTYRLIDAAERLKRGEAGSLAELAASLGYFDQPHFVRDFKAVVGRTPGDFLAAHGGEQSTRSKPWTHSRSRRRRSTS